MLRAIAILLLTVSAAAAAETPPAGPWFGQAPPDSTAVVFAPGVVSLEGRFEYALSFAPAGDEMLFSAELEGEPACVFHSRLVDGAWTPIEKARLSGGARRAEMEAFFSPDGESVHFAPFDEGLDVRVWVVDRGPDGWRNPRPLGPPVSEIAAFFPNAAASGALYYSDILGYRVMRAVLEGDAVVSAEPVGLDRSMHGFVASDESLLLFDSRPAREEDADIWVSFRAPDGGWGEPAPLGPAVNTEHNETCPSLSPDGRFLFFSRYDEPGGVSNIRWIGAAVLDAARAEATGRVP